MEEIYNRYKELALKKREIEKAQQQYKEAYRKMLIDFIKACNYKYVEVDGVVGIVKPAEPDRESQDPYVLKFYPLKDNGVPSMKAECCWALSTNDFDTIRATVKPVEIEFKD